MKQLLPIIVVSSTLSITAFAQVKPQRLASDHRIQVVNYSPDNVVPVLGTTFIATRIQFGKHEVIQRIVQGDQAAWSIFKAKGPTHAFYLKPTVVGSTTNMSVDTSSPTGARHYTFSLHSQAMDAKHRKPITYVLQFNYPGILKEEKAQAKRYRDLTNRSEMNHGRKPGQYNWDYSFSGSRTIMPVHVYDDGHFTYLQLQPNQPVPAVFAVNNAEGKESVVNYRRTGNIIKILTIAPQFTLRDGQYNVASIFNNRLIHRIEAND